MYKFVYIVILLVLTASCQGSGKTVGKDGGIIITAQIDSSVTDSQALKDIEVIKKRIRSNAGNDPVVRTDDNRHVTIELPLESDTALFHKLLVTSGDFNILETYNNDELSPEIYELEKLAEEDGYRSVFTFTVPKGTRAEYPTPFIIYCYGKDLEMTQEILRSDEARKYYPGDLEIIPELLPLDVTHDLYAFIATKKPDTYEPITIDMIDKASVKSGRSSVSEIYLELKRPFHENWRKMTEKNIGRPLAIVIDGRVYSYPMVNMAIDGGKATIMGDFDKVHIHMLASILNSGGLTAPVTINSIELIPAKKK